jgi:hypothetical protein
MAPDNLNKSSHNKQPQHHLFHQEATYLYSFVDRDLDLRLVILDIRY